MAELEISVHQIVTYKRQGRKRKPGRDSVGLVPLFGFVLQGWEGAVIGLEGLLLLGGSTTKTGPKTLKNKPPICL